MATKKLERKDFFKYLAGVFTNTGLELLSSFSQKVEKKMPGGAWVRAITLDAVEALPRLLFLQGYWVFITDKADNAFKALCPYDNSMLQYRLPDNHLFCLRCSRCYCPTTGQCLSAGNAASHNLNLTPLSLKTREGGVFVYLEK